MMRKLTIEATACPTLLPEGVTLEDVADQIAEELTFLLPQPEADKPLWPLTTICICIIGVCRKIAGRSPHEITPRLQSAPLRDIDHLGLLVVLDRPGAPLVESASASREWTP